MNFITVQLHFGHQVFYFTINSYFQVALFSDVFKQLPVMPFSATYQQTYFFVVEFGNNVLHNFFFTKFHHLFAGVVTVGITCPCKQQPHKIIYFGNCAHCASWVFVGGFLLNRNYGTQSGYFVHIRPFHISHKLPGIGAKTLHVASLSFVVNGIKSQ